MYQDINTLYEGSNDVNNLCKTIQIHTIPII